MKLTQTQKIISVLLVFMISVFVTYKSFSSLEAEAQEVQNMDVGIEVGNEGQDILDLADKIEKITIDSKVFSSTIFLALKDFGVSLVPEPQGRVNPFAVVGVESVVQNIPVNQKTTR